MAVWKAGAGAKRVVKVALRSVPEDLEDAAASVLAAVAAVAAMTGSARFAELEARASSEDVDACGPDVSCCTSLGCSGVSKIPE